MAHQSRCYVEYESGTQHFGVGMSATEPQNGGGPKELIFAKFFNIVGPMNWNLSQIYAVELKILNFFDKFLL